MKSQRRMAVLFVALAGSAFGAEPGDVNGDARVSFGDAYLLNRWFVTGLEIFEPAPGAGNLDSLFPCSVGNLGNLDNLPTLLFMEAVRRGSPAPLPHIVQAWPASETPRAEPSPAAAEVRIEMLAVRHDSPSGEVELKAKLTALHPVEFVAIVLENDEGLDLRPPHPVENPNSIQGKLDLRSRTEYYLLSGGAVPFHTDRLRSPFPPTPIEPAEEAILTLRAVLPRGTPPGSYMVDIRPDAEVVTSFGEIVRPQVLPGTLEVVQPISTGHDLPFPPLDFVDLDDRKIGGAAQIRITDAEGFPGDDVAVRVQIRAERPVNFLGFTLSWPRTALRIEEATPLYRDPEFGRVEEMDHFTLTGNGGPFLDSGAFVLYRYYPFPLSDPPANLPPDLRMSYFGYRPYSILWPSLKYLPQGEWTDLLELRFSILPTAQGRGELQVGFMETQDVGVLFHPYVDRRSSGDREACGAPEVGWSYEPTEWNPGTISILGGGNPPDLEPAILPEEANIRYFIGDSLVGEPGEVPEPLEVTGRPGDEVRVPVYLTTEAALWKIRAVFGFDESQLEFLGFDVHFVDFDGASITDFLDATLPNDITQVFSWYCTPTETRCVPALFPQLAWLHDERDLVPDGSFVLDVHTNHFEGSVYRAGTRYWVGDAVFRIRDDATASRTRITGTRVDWRPYYSAVLINSVSSGFPLELLDELLERYDVEAALVREGVIRIALDGATFLRGDADGNGNLDISDAVRVLSSLFQGEGPLECADAGDVNDDGSVDLADAIYSLTFQFGSGSPPPPPFPEPGLDPTEDDLVCSRG